MWSVNACRRVVGRLWAQKLGRKPACDAGAMLQSVPLTLWQKRAPYLAQVTTEDGAAVLTIERLPEGQPATGLSQRGQFDRNVVWTKKDLQYKSGWLDSWNKMW